MTMIDGIGDEVIQFMAVVLIIFVASLAWWSTNARPNRYRTILVMRSRPHHPVTVSIRTRPNTTNLQINSSQETPAEPTLATTTNTALESESSRNNGVIPLQEMDSIVDADMAMLDNNRLHFYRRIDAPAATQTQETQREEVAPVEAEPASNDQIREMDSIVSAMEADVTDGCDFFARNNEPNSSLKSSEEKDNDQSAAGEGEAAVDVASSTSTDIASADADQRKILIKLKYLNETLKEVEGSLDELLKDFKRRHFSAELSSERRVRLIFNGRVLEEAATLRALGLHHRAVVHCLVHPNRPQQTQQQSPPEAAANPELSRETPQGERWLDMENVLMTLVSVALTIVWFFRCEYSNMFTASASVALFALTVFYTVAIFGLYLSDTFHFDRRPNQPVPNN
ncbi:transmembrane and ubiquitin-like domain-containing protein 1 isoform X2 [Aricia agestis]|uniref:transmembrane and ubiquitin-like domain-containing protein 1 isoform X2 n=1 Tax=Aricia agestis TaxID=91739 RepID=UPI001C20325F|nr:transmembrane and ubiquitin-like domain-containing protein 1 isoform X2 [Aricia agestis]